jgi:hypothetical protein
MLKSLLVRLHQHRGEGVRPRRWKASLDGRPPRSMDGAGADHERTPTCHRYGHRSAITRAYTVARRRRSLVRVDAGMRFQAMLVLPLFGGRRRQPTRRRHLLKHPNEGPEQAHGMLSFKLRFTRQKKNQMCKG